MKLADILAKVAKGDTLTDEEKKFIVEYDEQKILDTTAANARKKAEKEAKDAKDALERLQGEFDEFKSQNDPAKKQTELDKALARIARLEKANADKDAKIAADARTARIRSLAKEAGISPAKGVTSETIDLLVDNLLAKVDIDDADAVKTALEVTDLVYGALDPAAADAAVPCRVKVRSAGAPKGPAVLEGTRCTFPGGIAGVAPGQSAVFYAADSDEILAGGVIA